MWGEDDPFVLKRLEGISPKPILSVANYISLDADCIVAGSTDRTIRFYDTQYLDEVMKTTMEKKNVSIVAVSGMSPEGDDPIIVTGGKDSVIQVWNASDPTPQAVINLPTNEVKALAVYQGSRTLIGIGTKDSKLLVWDLDENRLVETFLGHRASIYCVCISVTTPDLEFLDDDMKNLCIASGGADRTVRTWDLSKGKRIKKFRHSRSVSAIAVTNRGIRPLLATAGVERMIKIWDLDSGFLLRSLTGHLDQITTMTLWEGNQMFIISGSADHTIRIFDLINGECICILKGHRDSVLSLTIADWDQPKIISSSDDLSLIQWDLDAIIGAFYDNSEEGEGARTDLPPYLPPVEYTAPEELDRSRLSKEERKRIRRERKRAKRNRNLQSFNAANTKTIPNEYDENKEEYEFDEYDEDDHENVGSFVFDDDDDEHHHLNHHTTKETPQVSIPEAIKEAVAAVNNEVTKAEGEISPPELTQTPSKLSLLRIGSNKVIPMVESQDSHMEHQQVSGGFIKGILSRVFQHGHNKVGVEPSVSLDDSYEGVPSNFNSPEIETRKQIHAVITNTELTVTESDKAEKNINIDDSNTASDEVKSDNITAPPIIGDQTTSKPLVVGASHNIIEYKSITRMKTASFSQAVSDQMLEHNRMRSQASEKLKNRLMMKQKKNTTSESTSSAAAVEAPSTQDSGEALTQEEFKIVRAEKLKQHKLQERKRKESMLVSKNRSVLLLQKRLEDLKNKRLQQGGDDLVEMAEEGEDDDDDDFKFNSDNENER